MKRIITSICAFMAIGGLMSQSAVDGAQSPTADEGVRVLNPTSVKAPAARTNKGVAFFVEDFANGFAGNNGVGAWTTQDTGGDTPIWMEAIPGESPGGQYSDPATQALTSTTAANGWVIYDTDLFNTPTIIGDTQGFLISPSIDCSERNTVIIDWQQCFRYCCFSASPMTVGVSSDGGATWTDYAAQGDFIESANTFSGTNLPTSLDISCAAANQADVIIRFAYNAPFDTGYSHYFWGIDDVELSEVAAENDLSLNQITNGDVFNLYEFRITPIQQAATAENGGLLVGTIFENAGFADQTNVSFAIEILDESGTVLSTTNTPGFDYAANGNSLVCPTDQDSMYWETGWVPPAIGEYELRVTVSSDQTDDNPENNVMSKSIVYTDCMMGHDDEDLLDVELLPRESDDDPDLFENVGYGNFYLMENEGSEGLGALVRFGPETDPEFDMELRIYTVPPRTSISNSSFETTFYTIEAEDIPATAEEAFDVFIPFDDSVELLEFDTDSVAYFVGIANDAITGSSLTVMAQANGDTDNSTARINQTGDGDFVWFTSQQSIPYVRLIMDNEDCFLTSLNEIEDLETVALEQNMPNPASGMTTIRFSVQESVDVDLQITDNTGRVVYTKGMGNLAPGQHQVEFDASTLAAGVYQYALVSGNKRTAKSMMVVGSK